METPLMVADLWKPKSITLTAHASPSQTVTLMLACISIELKPLSPNGPPQWVIKVEDSRGFTAAAWEFLSFVDCEGMKRGCPVYNVREIEPGVLAMNRT